MLESAGHEPVTTPPSFHFIGICGTAMGAVAAAMKRRGYRVTGSDQKVYPPMSTFLESEGVELIAGFSPENIPADTDYVVVGNAMSRGNPEVESVLERKLRYLSLPETLKEFFLRGKRNFVVTGTHGKTTTTSMVTWLFENAGRDPSYMIGGIPRNLSTGARFNGGDFVVLEGDEYDTAFFDKRSKFHHYLPEAVAINNIEFDHADIYNSLDEIKLSFRRLLNLVPRNGIAVINGDDANCLDVASGAPAPVETVGFAESCDHRIVDVDYRSGSSAFTLDGERYEVPMDGEFNVRNAAVAVVLARFGGLSPDEVHAGLASFRGIARRQEVRGVVNGVTVIDDFAHHPTAVALAIKSMRQRYPDGRIWAVFEPRSNSTRRKVFQQPLCAALQGADQVVVSEIEDATKIPVNDRLDAAQLVDDIAAAGTDAALLPDVDSIVAYIAEDSQPNDVVLVLSNGGFGGIHQKLLDALA
ncbi:UDP-N-acetylmuramate:L-alanyl-gamma-D-glutamyl-meso-diaminopimelate ligase [Sulfuriroseicoccus oceanibius]|uniref:UDP-N-acetylmuramate:L-alanyl-gamma-D-glutamyl-meso-diaminopimelate ligase n=1 Tax=Sulfuriroseicoccus oceanibius TaxID=2707525 RepID=A0A6B3L3A3_9BACT|nr:UDP-N-acetylmuramate:L-alanyl-gamma-D-glutamyl-meso-diaminopimelate ligase [Sulfuriroseicoccus oceanibius]QQL44134.1 UDP-N-acetylmuramate:L-alanyl-gamma-D-glutamyl-meso-diaminopimelate ligase [Sulfuriroseicoccus oceanibius]